MPSRTPLLLALALVASLLTACGGEKKPEGEKKKEAAAAPFELAATDVTQVQRQSLTRRLPLSGTLTPLVQATVKTKVGGEVLSLVVREGQTVQHGDVLARIDTRNQQAVVATQRAALEKSRADLALAKLNYENNQRLLDKGFIAQNVLDSSRSLYESSLASEKLALSQLELAQIGMADAAVKAPISGIVSRRFVQPGEKVSPDAPLLQIVDLAKMEWQAAVPAAEIPSVKLGQTAEVSVDGYAAQVFSAKVERINPSSEEGSRSIIIYLSIANPDESLRGGMFAQGSLVIEQSEAVLVIPASAVKSEAGLSSVTVVEGGKLASKPVKLGLTTADAALVEVREGLAEGAMVVVAKLDTLKPGTAVVVKTSAEPATAQTAVK